MAIENDLKNKNRIFGLDLMRATAILMVICSHTLFFFKNPNKYVAQVVSMFGFFGVEIFFVLSGFLIGRILYRLYLEENFSFISIFTFLKRRWLRTLPNYFLILLLNIGIVFLLNVQVSISEIKYYFFFLQNLYTTMLPFFPESWSLSIEEFAYIIVAAGLYFSNRFSKFSNKSIQFLSIILILIAVFISTKIYYAQTTSNISLQQWNLSLKAVVIYRIDSILIGVLASWLSFNYEISFRKYRFFTAIISTFLFFVLYFCMVYFKILIISYPFFWNVIYLPLTSLLFALFLPLLFHWQKAPNWLSRPITLISLISYSLYLVHYSIVFQLFEFYLDETNLYLIVFFYLVTTFLLSFILYRFFESPILKYRDRKLNNSYF